MAWLGMNLDTVKGELPKWVQLKEDLNNVITSVNTQVNEADQNWNGPDSEQFVSEWESNHRPNLERIVGLLEALEQQLNRDIAGQESASNEYA